MKATASIISTYSADAFGVCSALYELGGLTVMHDPSGCNSTYTTHDEPRWFDMPSMVYISALSEMEAIMGDDQKLIGDIASAAQALHPRFIAIAGTPIPMMTGFDFEAAARLVELETGIPTFGFPTSGMETYISGASMAFTAILRRFAVRELPRTAAPSCNILGLTPLDVSIRGEAESIADFVRRAGFAVNARVAMGSDLEEISRAGAAHVNLVVSASGIACAKALREMFGTPYVVGLPVAGKYAAQLAAALHAAAEGRAPQSAASLPGGEIVIIGEGVRSRSLAEAIELETGKAARAVCATQCDPGALREKDVFAMDEDELLPQLQNARTVIADPLYKPIVPPQAAFLPLAHEAFSGRIYRDSILNLAEDCTKILNEV